MRGLQLRRGGIVLADLARVAAAGGGGCALDLHVISLEVSGIAADLVGGFGRQEAEYGGLQGPLLVAGQTPPVDLDALIGEGGPRLEGEGKGGDPAAGFQVRWRLRGRNLARLPADDAGPRLFRFEVLRARAHVEKDVQPSLRRQPIRAAGGAHLRQVDPGQVGHGEAAEPGPVACDLGRPSEPGLSLAAGNQVKAGPGLCMDLVQNGLDPLGRRENLPRRAREPQRYCPTFAERPTCPRLLAVSEVSTV